MPGLADLWRCPKCGEGFTSSNQWHSCGKFPLDALFRESQPQVRELYERFVAIVAACGPVTVIPQKTRVAFQVRMRFAAIVPQARCLKGHLVLAKPRRSRCFEKIESFSPGNHVHVFRVSRAEAFTGEFTQWIREAYRVGRQEHLGSRRPGSRTRRTRHDSFGPKSAAVYSASRCRRKASVRSMISRERPSSSRMSKPCWPSGWVISSSARLRASASCTKRSIVALSHALSRPARATKSEGLLPAAPAMCFSGEKSWRSSALIPLLVPGGGAWRSSAA